MKLGLGNYLGNSLLESQRPFYTDLDTWHKGISGVDFAESINNLPAKFLPRIADLNGTDDESYKSIANFGSSILSGSIKALVNVVDGVASIPFCTSDEVANQKYFFIQVSATRKINLSGRNGAIFTNVYESDNAITAGWHEIEWGSTGSAYFIKVDDVLVSGSATSGSDDGKWIGDIPDRDNMVIGSLHRSTTSFTALTIAWLKIDDGVNGYWITTGQAFEYDLSSLENHLTVSGSGSHFDYDAEGSTYPNTQGYSLWQKAANPDIQVPFDIDGNPLSLTAGVDIPTGYAHDRDVLKGGSKWNMADALVDFDPNSDGVNKLTSLTPLNGWSSLGGGQYLYTTNGSVSYLQQLNIITIGKEYELTYEVFANPNNDFPLFDSLNYTGVINPIPWQVGVHKIVRTATTDDFYLRMQASSPGGFIIGNILVKEVLPISIFDREDYVIQTATSRASLFYDANFPFRYQINEIADPRIYDTFFEAAYQDRIFGKIVSDGQSILRYDEELNYATQKTGTELIPINNYCKINQLAITPEVLFDGNTVAWFDYLENITEVTGVSVWGDKSGNSNDLLQADTSKQPTLNVNGILFDGVDNFMKAVAFTLIQPEFIYIVFKQITWVLNDYIFDGNTGNRGSVFQNNESSKLAAHAGSLSSRNDNLSLDTYGIIRVLYNGASSKLQVNNTIAITGDFGSNDMGGFTLGAGGTDAFFGNIEVKEVIIRKVADEAVDEASIYNYLSNKYGI